jgi:F-type H+-transporting ATPase subunit delta
VTLARAPDEQLKRAIQEALTRQLGKQVIPAFTVDPEILGGTVVRVGERVLDGSLRRRMTKLRRQLLAH